MKENKIGTVLKTETKVIAYVVICLVIIVLGISYALFFEVKGNEKNQIVKAGTLEFTYENGSQITNETKSECFIPMSSEEALTHSECEYKISITNTGSLPGNYNINLNSETVEKSLELSKLKIILKKEGEIVAGYPKEGTTTSLISNEKIEAGKVINYSIQMYVDESLTDANDDEKNISLKINGDAVVNEEEINPGIPAVEYIKNIETVESGDGLYIVSHDVSKIDKAWNKSEYRYAGVNPNNYVKFNNEIWRIIGVVNVKTERGIEQRVKIIRQDGIEGQKDFGNYVYDYKQNTGSSNTEYGSNDWTDSQLKDLLNGIYYESGKGDCYRKVTPSLCDFTGNGAETKGLDEIAKNMIDKEVIWNLGGWQNDTLLEKIYERERGTVSGNYNSNPIEWSKETDVGNKFNGVAMIYASDYGYAVGGDDREDCLSTFDYKESKCNENLWLFNNGIFWLLSPATPGSDIARIVDFSGGLRGYLAYGNPNVFPTIYLKNNIEIKLNFDENYGSIENPFILE